MFLRWTWTLDLTDQRRLLDLRRQLPGWLQGGHGIHEIVDDSRSLLTPPQDPVRLAQALDEALRRTWDERRIASRHGRSWDDVGRDLFQACQRVLGEHGGTTPATGELNLTSR